MRRSSIAWVLSLLLVLIQHGAVLHELGHLSHAGSIGSSVLAADPHALNGAICATCEGFAQIANPAAAGVLAVAVCPSGCLLTPDPRFAILATDSPTPRSRGPPQA